MRLGGHQFRVLFLLAFSPIWFVGGSEAASRTWIGGNNDWVDGGSIAHWSPADEPDTDDEAVFNTNNSVSLGSNNSVNGLTMSGGIDLSTNGFDLLVDGPVQLSGLSTNLFIGGAASELNADGVTINSGGTVELVGGTLVVDEELLALGGIVVNSGGALMGHGTVNLVDAPLFVPNTLLNNNGTLTALSRPANILLPPPVGTLTINAAAANARIDLDGSGENGVVNVNRNQTLDINGTLADAFNGTLSMFQNTTLDISSPWTLGAGGAINVDNGAIIGIPGTPAGTSTIAGGALTQTGGTFTVVDADGVLIFNAPFTQTGGTFTNNGHVIFNANASMTVANFDFDAGEWTVQNNALFTVNVTDYDPGVANNAFDSEITLNSADINVNTGDPAFVMNGTLNMISNVAGLVTTWEGEPVVIGDDIGALDARVNVSGTGVSRFATSVRINADAKIAVAAGATLDFTGSVLFQSVNGGNQAQFSGPGTARFNSSVTVVEATTLDMAGGTVDLDGVDAVGDQITLQAPLVINAATMSSFGNVNNNGVNVILIDASSGGATGSLTVNLDDPDAEWTLNPQGSMALFSNSPATLLHGSDINLNGSVTVTGAVGSAARVDIGGTMNLQTAAGGFMLQGGTLADPNRLEGGQINGPGELQASSGRALVGHGAIGADIDFDGTAELVADGGILTVTGGILDVGTIRVNSGAVLNALFPITTNVTDGGIVMAGGTLQGSDTVTTASVNPDNRKLRGVGTVASPLTNNGFIEAQGGTLQFTNTSSDWDGASNAGHLRAVGGSTLRLADNATFGFTGSVIAVENSRVFTDGFALDFNPGSTITLAQGTYESTHSTDLGGAVVVQAGAPSTIKVQVNRFLDFESTSTTTLNGNLRLESNNASIAAGATFSGTGALVVPDGSHLVLEANANVNVLVQNDGAIRPAGFDAVGRVDVRDYQQSSDGELFMEIAGTALNQFDRLVVNGAAQLGGYLNVDIDGGFVPAVGNTFNIIATTAGVTGAFDYYDIQGFPAGLTVKVNYLPTIVQLEVVNREFFAADFDEDGDVDPTDYAIWKGAFGLNQLGDANGDNISDAADYTIWRDQLGSVSGGAGTGSFFAAGQATVPEPSWCAFLSGVVVFFLQTRVSLARWTCLRR